MFYKEWEKLEKTAIMVGLSYEQFWNEPPRFFNKRIEVFTEKRKSDLENLDARNYELASYIATGVNNPKKFPKNPYHYDKPKHDLQALDTFFKSLPKINKNNTKKQV